MACSAQHSFKQHWNIRNFYPCVQAHRDPHAQAETILGWVLTWFFKSKHTWRQMSDQIQAKFVGWAHQMNGTIWLQRIIMMNMCDKHFIEQGVGCLRDLSAASASCKERTSDWLFVLWNQVDPFVSGGLQPVLDKAEGKQCQYSGAGNYWQLGSLGAVLLQKSLIS